MALIVESSINIEVSCLWKEGRREDKVPSPWEGIQGWNKMNEPTVISRGFFHQSKNEQLCYPPKRVSYRSKHILLVTVKFQKLKFQIATSWYLGFLT